MEAGSPPPQEQQTYAYKKLSREEKTWLSRTYHKRVKTATNVTLGQSTTFAGSLASLCMSCTVHTGYMCV